MNVGGGHYIIPADQYEMKIYMNNPLTSLPTDPLLRHGKLHAIISRHEENYGIISLTRSAFRILRKKATREDYEIFFYANLVKEYEINKERLQHKAGEPWTRPKQEVEFSILTTDGKITDDVYNGIQRDIKEVGYTMLAEPVPEGGADGYMKTLGLPEIWGHLNFKVAESQNLTLNGVVLDDLVEMAKAGKVFQHGEWVNNILEGRLGFTVRLFREKQDGEEFFRVGYYDLKGKRSVKVVLPQQLLDAIRGESKKVC